MAAVPGRYVYAVPLVRNAEEAIAQIKSRVTEAGIVEPAIVAIHSGAVSSDRSVPRTLSETPADYPTGSHVVAICTHEGLMAADLHAYAGWTLLIDEVPTVMASGTFRSPAAAGYLAQHYKLTPVDGTGWSAVQPDDTAPGVRALAVDDFLRPLGEFAKRAAQRGAFVDFVDWTNLEDGRRWSWWSMWSIAEAKAFAEIVLVGNAFSTSMTRQVIARSMPGSVQFVPFDLPVRPERLPRTVVVHYFAERPGTTTYWAAPAGRRCVEAVGNWLRANAPGDLLWSANSKAADVLADCGVPGQREQPILTGLNAYRHLTWAAIIYSAKMQRDEHVALRLFDLDAEQVRRTREYEVILQFAFRTALREDGFTGTIHVAVYDRAQAEFLADYLNKHDLARTEVRYEDVGIAQLYQIGQTATADREHDSVTIRRRASAKERAKRHRDLKQAEAQARGERPRPRGRPKKT